MSLFCYSLQFLSFFPVSFCFECRLKHLSLTFSSFPPFQSCDRNVNPHYGFIYVYCNLTIENLFIHQNNTTIVDDLAYSNYFEYLCLLNKHFEVRNNERITGPY